jgi:DNA ligase-4
MTGASPMKCYSFFKVGGGFKVEDYANIRHHTEGKWIDYDPKRPPTDFIELGGGDLQYERPDVWIKPNDSIVLSVKAASVTASDQFRMGFTLRFPRFKRLRMDRSWDSALSIQEFMDLKARVEEESRDKEFKLDTRRKVSKRAKKDIVIAGDDQEVETPYAGPQTMVFEGLNFCVLSEALKPQKKSKAELEQLIKANGGNIFQSPTAKDDMVCIADKKVVKAASIMKSGSTNIVKPAWVFDTLMQSEVDVGKPTFILPFEQKHMFFAMPGTEGDFDKNVDEFGDSYARDVGVDELKGIFSNMNSNSRNHFDADEFLEELGEHEHDMGEMKGWLFKNSHIYFNFEHESTLTPSPAEMTTKDLRMKLASNLARFYGASIAEELADETITHVVVDEGSFGIGTMRKEISMRRRVPRFVTLNWIEDSWKEGTLLDEERYAPVGN